MTSTIALIALPHVPRKLLEMVVEGQTVLPYREIWLKACNGELPMVIFERGRWYCPEPELPALAQALGLRLKPSSLPLAAEPDAESSKPPQNPSLPPAADTPTKPEPVAKPAPTRPARSRASRSAA
jgi:hypothetical protein